MSIPIIGKWLDKGKDSLDDYEVPAPQQPVDIGNLIAQGYGEPYFRFQSENQRIESKEKLMQTVRDGFLSYTCKDALLNFIQNYYDKNVMLSNLPEKHGEEIAYYYMLIAKMTVVLNASDKSDRNRPEFTTVWNLIERQTQFLFSRATGKKRERIIDAIINVGLETVQRISKSGNEASNKNERY